jgi:hypothetical protein
MVDNGLIKDIIIKENDNIIQKIESNFLMLQDREWVFRTSSKKNYTREYRLTEGISVNYALIKR